jgi:hypothetical protein
MMEKETQANECALPAQEKAVALPLNDAEKEIISKYFENLNSGISVSVVDKKRENGEGYCEPEAPRGTDHDKLTLFAAAICKATGATDIRFASTIYSSCVHALIKNPSDAKQVVDKSNEVLIALNSLKPTDEMESMLISKLIVLYFQSMEFFKRSISETQTSPGIDLNINRSTKLTRLYNETLETLMRYRRKGEQKVVVQHVQVNEGGKAVVAGQMVSAGGGER